MVVQFNLLPDVKLEYIKTKRTKRMVVMVASIVGAASLFIFSALFVYVNVIQRQHLNALNESIHNSEQQLAAVPDLNKVLTIQNQIGSLSSLHAQDPAASRFIGYLEQVTPAKATISNVTLDLSANTITISGSADALSTVNKFVDTMKFTNYKIDGQNEQKPAFENVVLSSFTKSDDSTNYELTMTFDPVIFDNTQKVKLVVPKIISTRSEVDKPSELFQKSQTNTNQGQ